MSSVCSFYPVCRIIYIRINIRNLIVLNFDFYTTQGINSLNESIPIHTDIICNVQIQVGVQRLYCILCSTFCECRIDFVVVAFSHTQVGITIDRYQANLLSVIVDACYHYHIAETTVIAGSRSAIQSKNRNVGIIL